MYNCVNESINCFVVQKIKSYMSFSKTVGCTSVELSANNRDICRVVNLASYQLHQTPILFFDATEKYIDPPKQPDAFISRQLLTL